MRQKILSYLRLSKIYWNMTEQVTNSSTETQKGTVDGLLACLSAGSLQDPDLAAVPPVEGNDDTEIEMDGDRRVKKLEEWTTGWETGHTPFHKTFRYPNLVRYIDKLVDGRKGLKFFFPLCGKSVDMKWMYDEGHTVVGVEASPKAVEEFFLDNNLTYVAENVPAMDGALYKTEDNRIRIYCGDLFKFSAEIEKDMEAIFDRGSLVAINKTDRRRYADLLISMMAPDARYLLMTFSYDSSMFCGPPHHIPLDVLAELYGSKCHLDLLLTEDVYECEVHKGWGLDSLDEQVHLITVRQ